MMSGMTTNGHGKLQGIRTLRWRVRLRGGRELILYGKSLAEVAGKIPATIPHPLSRIEYPTPAVENIEPAGVVLASGVVETEDECVLVADNRKAPGT